MQVKSYDTKIERFISSLERSTEAKIARLTKLLETYGQEIGMPYSKKISPDLFELRIHGQQEVRIFYTFHNNQAVLIHGFVKKSEKAPSREIATAQKIIKSLT